MGSLKSQQDELKKLEATIADIHQDCEAIDATVSMKQLLMHRLDGVIKLEMMKTSVQEHCTSLRDRMENIRESTKSRLRRQIEDVKQELLQLMTQMLYQQYGVQQPDYNASTFPILQKLTDATGKLTNLRIIVGINDKMERNSLRYELKNLTDITKKLPGAVTKIRDKFDQSLGNAQFRETQLTKELGTEEMMISLADYLEEKTKYKELTTTMEKLREELQKFRVSISRRTTYQ
eukprot:GHVU01026083.1.p1 GENE.GHVU01026083.1~~GHVU01026083.1.p1  ORF type:complete len:264 (+),score=39.64 GHVU01026083.1:91-792(+)